jgi:SAM-dependent methyltransferase
MEAYQEKNTKEFWNNLASDRTLSTDQVTHKDIWQRWLEIELIKRFLRPESRVLDVGCGNGYTTKKISALVKEIIGIDFSPEMIKRAVEENIANSKGAVKFAVMDVLELNKSSFGLFDIVVSERCLINLAGWEEQKKAISNIASVIEPGGRYIFVEGSRDGRKNLNALRQTVGLEAMPPVWHNVDFDLNATLDYLENFFEIEENLNLGIYDYISRVVHPLLVYPEQPKYDAKINEVAAKLALQGQEFGKISRVIFLVLKKKTD